MRARAKKLALVAAAVLFASCESLDVTEEASPSPQAAATARTQQTSGTTTATRTETTAAQDFLPEPEPDEGGSFLPGQQADETPAAITGASDGAAEEKPYEEPVEDILSAEGAVLDPSVAEYGDRIDGDEAFFMEWPAPTETFPEAAGTAGERTPAALPASPTRTSPSPQAADVSTEAQETAGLPLGQDAAEAPYGGRAALGPDALPFVDSLRGGSREPEEDSAGRTYDGISSTLSDDALSFIDSLRDDGDFPGGTGGTQDAQNAADDGERIGTSPAGTTPPGNTTAVAISPDESEQEEPGSTRTQTASSGSGSAASSGETAQAQTDGRQSASSGSGTASSSAGGTAQTGAQSSRGTQTASSGNGSATASGGTAQAQTDGRQSASSGSGTASSSAGGTAQTGAQSSRGTQAASSGNGSAASSGSTAQAQTDGRQSASSGSGTASSSAGGTAQTGAQSSRGTQTASSGNGSATASGSAESAQAGSRQTAQDAGTESSGTTQATVIEAEDPAWSMGEPVRAFTPSRSVQLRTNEYLEATYPGIGWVYLGETVGEPLMNYIGRAVPTGDTKFTLQAKQEGTTYLHFYKYDALSDTYIDDYLEVLIKGTGASDNRVTAPLYEAVVPERLGSSGSSDSTGTSEDGSQGGSRGTGASLSQDKGSEAANGRTAEADDGRSVATGSDAVTDEGGAQTVIQTTESSQSDATRGTRTQTAQALPSSESTADDTTALSADDLLLLAQRAYDQRQYGDALMYLNDFFEKSATRIDEGLFLKAQTLEAPSDVRNIRSALETYETLVASFPESKLWERANQRITYLKRFYFNIR